MSEPTYSDDISAEIDRRKATPPGMDLTDALIIMVCPGCQAGNSMEASRCFYCGHDL